MKADCIIPIRHLFGVTLDDYATRFYGVLLAKLSLRVAVRPLRCKACY